MSEVVIGVDLGIRKIAYSLWRDGDLTQVGAYQAMAGLRQVELYTCVDYLDDVLDQLICREEAEVLVVIEEPLVGNNIKYSMKISQLYGAVLHQLACYTEEPEVIAAGVGQWKREVVGRGNATKDDVRNYIDVTHKRYAALCGDDQDKYDAVCIGLYGLLLTARADALREGASL